MGPEGVQKRPCVHAGSVRICHGLGWPPPRPTEPKTNLRDRAGISSGLFVPLRERRCYPGGPLKERHRDRSLLGMPDNGLTLVSALTDLEVDRDSPQELNPRLLRLSPARARAR